MCTSFTIMSTKGAVIYGRTMEFTLQLGSEVIVVPAGVELTGTGVAGDPGVGGHAWTATHTAVGLNALGLRMIIDGANDAGLVAAAFNFPVSAAFEAITEAEQAEAIGCHEVPLYLLTTCTTIAECREAIAAIRVHGPRMAVYGGQVPMLHFAVHDATGASIVLEWTDGALQVHDNPTTVLTNEPPFPMQLAHLAEYAYLSAEPPAPVELPGLTLTAPSSGGGMQALPGGFLATNRFVRAFWAARSVPAFDTPEQGVEYARHILNGFDIPPGSVLTPAGTGESGGQTGWEMTEWSIMADTANRALYVNTFAHQGWTRIDITAIAEGLDEIAIIPLPAKDRFHELTR